MNTKTVYITRNELFKNIPMILCNNITTIDTSFIDDNFEIFYDDCEECNGSGEKEGTGCEECLGEGRHDSEPYQYFISSINEWHKKFMQEYGVIIGYSELLDTEIIPIFDYGTSWSCFSYSKEVTEDYQLAHNETLTRSTPY